MNSSLSISISEETYEYIKNELQRRFPQYKVVREKRKRQAFVLIRTSEEDKLASKGGKPKARLTLREAVLRNTNLKWLIDQLNESYYKYWFVPIIDRTGYTAPVDIHLKAEMSLEDSLKKALRGYELDLITAEQEIEVLVILENEEAASGAAPPVRRLHAIKRMSERLLCRIIKRLTFIGRAFITLRNLRPKVTNLRN